MENKRKRCCVLQGEIRGTGFNNEVDKFFGLIEVGKVKHHTHTHTLTMINKSFVLIISQKALQWERSFDCGAA